MSKIPYVRNNILHRPDGTVILRLPLAGQRTGWFDWLQNPVNTSFRYESPNGIKLTCNKEHRRGTTGNDHYYWIAYKSIAGKKRRVSLGKARLVTIRRLEQAARRLAQLELGHSVPNQAA